MTVHAATRATAVALTFTFAAVVLMAAITSTSRAHAQVADGGTVVFEECSVVTITVLDSDATFTSVFWRFGPDGDLGISSQDVGSSKQIPGEIPGGVELVLGIVVNDTGNTFKTGDGSLNPDNEVHAIVSSSPAITGTTVGFEDKAAGEPFADFDYDDAVLQLTVEPCAEPEQVTLEVQIDPASTGTGGVAGAGTFDIGALASPSAVPASGSTFGGWSGDCGGFAQDISVVMDTNKTCFALFLADATPTPTATPPPPIAGPEPVIGINNTRTSPSPANVDDTVVFRIDVSLADVPLANEAEVLITFDDGHLDYIGSLTSECTLFPIGVVCDFGPATTGFSFDLDFTALEVTPSTATDATLGADYDGAGPGAAETAGPATADVAIVDVEGIQLPPLGDGSASDLAATGGFGPLVGVLGIIVLGAVTAAGFGATRRQAAER